VQIALVDDDPAEQQQLHALLKQYASTRKIKMQVLVFSDGEEILHRGSAGLDAILLDIHMPHIDGMTAAQRIRETDPDVPLIFVTHRADYALQGYRVAALDFLVKPVEYALLENALDRVAARCTQAAPKYLYLRTGKKQHRLDIRHLIYAESQNHRLLLQTDTEAIQYTGSLRTLEKAIHSYGFFCCHAAYLINLERVEYLDGSDILVNGYRIPVSKHRRKQLLEQLASRWGAQL
jgi:DNA-binding LytR/AlgR family response regulator